MIHPSLLSLDTLPCVLKDVPNRVSASGEHSSLRTLGKVELNCHDLTKWSPTPGGGGDRTSAPQAPPAAPVPAPAPAPPAPVVPSAVDGAAVESPVVDGGSVDGVSWDAVGPMIALGQIGILVLLVVYRKQAISWGL